MTPQEEPRNSAFCVNLRNIAISQVTEPGAPFRNNLRNGLDWVSSRGRGDHSSPLNSFRLALPTHVPHTTARIGAFACGLVALTAALRHLR
jgi:hypothetical protein